MNDGGACAPYRSQKKTRLQRCDSSSGGFLERTGIMNEISQLGNTSLRATSADVPSKDQERELRIQAEGLLLRAEMLAWERTGDFSAHDAAQRHQANMFELIKKRPTKTPNNKKGVMA